MQFKNYMIMGIDLNILILIGFPQTQVIVNQYQVKQPTNSHSVC